MASIQAGEREWQSGGGKETREKYEGSEISRALGGEREESVNTQIRA